MSEVVQLHEGPGPESGASEDSQGEDARGEAPRDEAPPSRPDEPPGEPPGQPGAVILWLRRAVVGISLSWVLLIAVVFALRVGFPLELEWMEGGTLQQAFRVQQGQPVYGPPSPDFVPFLYTPLYPALVAALGWIFPLDYALARAVSILAVLATCGALWRLCAFEDKPLAHRLLAIGLFLSGYVFGFRWLDLARGDAMFLALLAWGLALLRESEGSWTKAVAAGALVGLAFWTKQTAAVFVLASGLAGLLVAPRQVWAYAGTVALVDGGGVLLGQWLTDGWLWTWIYEMHQSHAFNEERFRKKTWGMFLHAAPFLALLLIVLLGAALGLVLRRVRQTRRLLIERAVEGETAGKRALVWLRALWLGLREAAGPIYWGVILAAGLLVSALGYSTQFAEPNAFIPGICFGAAFFGVALPDSSLGRDELAGMLRVRKLLEGAGLVLVGGQLCFALLVEPMYQPIQSHGLEQGLPDSYAWQDPWRTIPRPHERRQARELRERIEGLDPARGELLALHRPWWSILAGGPGHVGAMGINDVDAEDRAELQAQIRKDLAAGRYQAVWIEGSVPRWLTFELRKWSVGERRFGERRVRPMSGWMSRAGMVTKWQGEQLLLVPPTPREPPEGVEVIADFEDGSLDGFEVEGLAFGRRAARSHQRGLPIVGPHGGARLLSSAVSRRRLQAKGIARSPSFVLPPGGSVEVLLGTSGRRAKLAARIVGEEGRAVTLELPETRFDLRSVRWSVPDDWAGATVRLELVDRSTQAALFADDLWVVARR